MYGIVQVTDGNKLQHCKAILATYRMDDGDTIYNVDAGWFGHSLLRLYLQRKDTQRTKHTKNVARIAVA